MFLPAEFAPPLRSLLRANAEGGEQNAMQARERFQTSPKHGASASHPAHSRRLTRGGGGPEIPAPRAGGFFSLSFFF